MGSTITHRSVTVCCDGERLEDDAVYLKVIKMAEEIKPTKIIDAGGSHCLGPLMVLIKNYKVAKTGDITSLYSSDSGTKTDASAWIKKSGNELLGVYDRNGYFEIILKKTRQ